MAEEPTDIVVAQLTDLHVGPEDDPICVGNAARLAACVERIAQMRRTPDLLLLTGDLTEYGDDASLGRALASLAALDQPACFALGNHDVDRTPAHEVRARFNLDDDWVSSRSGGLRVLCADSAVTDLHGGAFDPKAAAALGRRLAEQPNTRTLLAVHHPPCPLGLEWIDPDPDEQWTQRLKRVVERAPQVVGVVSGHVHLPAVTTFAGRRLVISPAIAPQSHVELAPLSASPDGRTFIEDAPPAFTLHRFTERAWTSVTVNVDGAAPLVSFDAAGEAMLHSVRDGRA